MANDSSARSSTLTQFAHTIEISVAKDGEDGGSVKASTNQDGAYLGRYESPGWSGWLNTWASSFSNWDHDPAASLLGSSVSGSGNASIRTVAVKNATPLAETTQGPTGKSKLTVKIGFSHDSEGWVLTQVDPLFAEEQESNPRYMTGFVNLLHPDQFPTLPNDNRSDGERLSHLLEKLRESVDHILKREHPAWWYEGDEKTRPSPYWFMQDKLRQVLDETFAEAEKRILAGQSKCIDHVIHHYGVGSECDCTGEARKLQTVRSEYGNLISVAFSF